MRERSNSWNAAQQKKKREACHKLREDTGYNPDAYREKDTERATGRALKKIKEVYRKYARKYEEFLIEVKDMHEDFRLEEGYPAPTLEELKQYMRWFIESTKGRLNPDGWPIIKSTLNHAENLVLGFFLETGNRILERNAAELYNISIQDRTIKAIGRQKFDLKLCDFEVASLIPRSEQKFERGLRYENIQLVLFRASIWDCDEPIYTGGSYLLALALYDNVLDGFSSAKDVFEQRIPEGQNELVLPWTKEAKGRCVVRHATAVKGVSEDPLTQEHYSEALGKIFTAACYHVQPTIYAMRRKLSAAVKEKYSSAHVAQILAQKSKSVYGNDYLASCSAVDVVNNTLWGRTVDNTHVEYFQGFKLDLDLDPELTAKRAAFFNAKTDYDANHLLNEYKAMKRVIYSKKLEQVMPELGRLVARILLNKPLSFFQKRLMVEDLLSHCRWEFDVVYRPGDEPVEGQCLVKGCGQNKHIYTWIPLQYLRSPEFEEYCHYEVIVFRHTTTCAGYCIEYMAFENTLTWPSKYPDPLCHYIADNEQDYRRHLYNVKLSAKRENRHAQNERPRKIRKSHISQPPGTGTKELKITFWEPPQPHPEAAQTRQGNQDHLNKRACRIANYCGLTSEVPCISPDGDNTLSAFVHSISSAACSVSSTLCHSDDGSKQCDEGSLTEQLRCYTLTEQLEIDSACQTSHEELIMKILRSEDIAVLETDGMSNPYSLTLSPPSNKLEGKLANNELLAATESVQIFLKLSEIHTIKNTIYISRLLGHL
ncbi:hypothetical protein BDV33DRAFT_229259 [Aspergillus novoparasiticus]|uniref:Uncharacterized protein n=1 Tax=Aspergillus novoparasiticus TaxID=986946 RepID=A0A5N6FBE6_9EURO|nr:hypothetical protein BDV33DRAFT_229259 [Aspergillus novoparasiticus]